MAKFIFSGWNIRKLISYDSIKKDTKIVSELCQSVLSVPEVSGTAAGSFEDMMKKAGISEEDLKKKIKMSLTMTRIYLVFGIVLVNYGIYLFGHFPPLAGLVTIVFSILMFSYAFREHITAVRMRIRRLDIGFMGWFKATFFKK